MGQRRGGEDEEQEEEEGGEGRYRYSVSFFMY